MKTRSPSPGRDPVPTSRKASPVTKRRGWRWSMTTLLLMMGTVGVVTRAVILSRQNQRLRNEIATMRMLARELQVLDETQFAVIKRYPRWFEENIWDVFLPAGQTYRLNLVTRGVDPTRTPRPFESVVLPSGYHTIEYRRKFEDQSSTWRIEVLVDQSPAMTFTESADWESSMSHSSQGGYSRSTQRPVDEPLFLERLRFHTPTTPNTTASRPTENGILLWIENEGTGGILLQESSRQ